MVSTMAHYTGALQGDTDSVHFILPKGVAPSDLHKTPMAQGYYDCMKRAGYPNPRQRGKDMPIEDGIEGLGTYGTWKVEQKAGSEESHLVALKRYSHRFRGDDGKAFHKQAVHTIVAFGHPDIDAIPPEKKKDRKQKEQELLHAHMAELIAGQEVKYKTKRRPMRPKAAYRRGLQAGKFDVEARVIAPVRKDENTWIDESGVLHWHPLEINCHRIRGKKKILGEIKHSYGRPLVLQEHGDEKFEVFEDVEE